VSPDGGPWHQASPVRHAGRRSHSKRGAWSPAVAVSSPSCCSRA